jgi:hypothetical protein
MDVKRINVVRFKDQELTMGDPSLTPEAIHFLVSRIYPSLKSMPYWVVNGIMTYKGWKGSDTHEAETDTIAEVTLILLAIGFGLGWVVHWLVFG